MDTNIFEQYSKKEQIAIVAVGYNRLNGLKRLLDSLDRASYPAGVNIPLIISIDASGDESVYEYARSFQWNFGDKIVNIEQSRLGLKAHLFQCGDLTRYFKAVVILEDDLFVSEYYYYYITQAVEKYGQDDRIAQISLYKNESNGYASYPFEPMQTGNDVYLMQDVSTWGQIFTERMWNSFVKWRDRHTEDDMQNVDMPSMIKGWARAWSKYYNAFVVDTNRYVVYPNVPVSTNFNDDGEHGGGNSSVVQVNLLQGRMKYRMPKFEELVRYDIYCNNEQIYDWLGLKKDSLLLDLYGVRNTYSGQRFILSTRKLPFYITQEYGLCMRPLEINIKNKISGKGICLYDVLEESNISLVGKYNDEVTPYFLHGFGLKHLRHYLLSYYKSALMRKLFKK